MRRSASEILRNLEARVKRLEKSAGFFDLFTGNIDLKDIGNIISKAKYRDFKIVNFKAKSPEEIYIAFTRSQKDYDNGFVYIFKGKIDQNASKVRYAAPIHNMIMMNHALRNRGQGGGRGRGPSDPVQTNHVVVTFEPDYRAMKLKPGTLSDAMRDMRFGIQELTVEINSRKKRIEVNKLSAGLNLTARVLYSMHLKSK